MSTTGFNLATLFADKNFQNMLAGVGSQLGGPGSVGAALGNTTLAYNKAIAAQNAAKQTLERNRQTTPQNTNTNLAPDIAPSSLNVSATPVTSVPIAEPNILEQLLTPPNIPGPTSASRDASGQINVKYTPDPLAQLATAPTNAYDALQANIAQDTQNLFSEYLPPQTTQANLANVANPSQNPVDDLLGDNLPRRSVQPTQYASLEPSNIPSSNIPANDVLASLGEPTQVARATNTSANSANVDIVPSSVASSLESHSNKYGADSNLAKAIVMQESGGLHTDANGKVKVSPKGARGYMQLMDSTARKYNVDANNPEQNLEGGVREIAYLQTLSKNPKDILAGYVGGPDGMKLYQSQNATTPQQKETLATINAYVESTYARYQRMQAASAKSTPSTIPEVPKGTKLDVPAFMDTRKPPQTPTTQPTNIPAQVEATPSSPSTKPANVPTQTDVNKTQGLPPISNPDTMVVNIEKESQEPIGFTNPVPVSPSNVRQVVRQNYDLRGLSPDEVDKVTARALEAERVDVASDVSRRQSQEIRETDEGLELFNKSTGASTPITRDGKVDGRRYVDRDKFSKLSNFSRQMSVDDNRVRTKMSDAQSKTFEYGSRALQANERQHRLEQKYASDPSQFATRRAQILQTLEALPADAPMHIVGQLATGINIVSNAAQNAYDKWIAQNPNASVNAKVDFWTSLGLGAAEARVKAILENRIILTADERAFLENQIEFSTAMLRRESGAAINAGEFMNTYRQYFPVIGDTPENVRRKMTTRRQTIRGMRTSAGRPLLVPDIDED